MTISIYQMTSIYQVLPVCSELCSNKEVANWSATGQTASVDIILFGQHGAYIPTR